MYYYKLNIIYYVGWVIESKREGAREQSFARKRPVTRSSFTKNCVKMMKNA